jgi:hypothetical protein
MIILSKGYKKPETGDFGDVWFPALEDNIDLSNSHSHDGINGEKISAISLTASTLTVLSASFIDQSNGYYRATVTVPGGGLVDNFVVTVKDPTTKDVIYAKFEKLSATQFYIHINTQQNVEVYFGV